MAIRPGRDDVLVVIDVQNDFCPGGALGVQGGDEVVDVVNRIAGTFLHVILTQDWHPPGHLSFASSHEGRQPFETIELDHGTQVLWPDHCVQGTGGARIHEGLDVGFELLVRKGCDRGIDSYSAFFENDRRTPTGLGGYLEERGARVVYMAGLATDFCVQHSALDAMRLGFEVVVVEEACRSIDLEGSLAAAWKAMDEAGVRRVSDP